MKSDMIIISDLNGNPVASNVTNGDVIINTPASDKTPPASITALRNSLYAQNYITWNWINTMYTISTHTVDTSGNINQTRVNHTARTAPWHQRS